MPKSRCGTEPPIGTELFARPGKQRCVSFNKVKQGNRSAARGPQDGSGATGVVSSRQPVAYILFKKQDITGVQFRGCTWVCQFFWLCG